MSDWGWQRCSAPAHQIHHDHHAPVQQTCTCRHLHSESMSLMTADWDGDFQELVAAPCPQEAAVDREKMLPLQLLQL